MLSRAVAHAATSREMTQDVGTMHSADLVSACTSMAQGTVATLMASMLVLHAPKTQIAKATCGVMAAASGARAGVVHAHHIVAGMDAMLVITTSRK